MCARTWRWWRRGWVVGVDSAGYVRPPEGDMRGGLGDAMGGTFARVVCMLPRWTHPSQRNKQHTHECEAGFIASRTPHKGRHR